LYAYNLSGGIQKCHIFYASWMRKLRHNHLEGRVKLLEYRARQDKNEVMRGTKFVDETIAQLRQFQMENASSDDRHCVLSSSTTYRTVQSSLNGKDTYQVVL
jgi:hypothetical protein